MDPYIGHEGHLTEEQANSFATFKRSLQTADLYAPATDTEPVSDTDTNLLRFLRARSFNPGQALKQYTATTAWRKEHDVDNLYRHFDHDEFEDGKRCYPHWTGRRAKNGCPLYVYCIAELGPQYSYLNSIPAEKRYQRMIALHELFTRFTLPLCSQLPHPSSPTPIADTVTILDMKNTSLRTLWNVRELMQLSSSIATAHYPETLNSVIIVNAPSFFPTIWGWVKGWLDEGTRRKFTILSTDYSVLPTFVESDNLPKMYGGNLAWEFVDEPNLDEEARKVIGKMPRGPAVFVKGRVGVYVDGDLTYPSIPSE